MCVVLQTVQFQLQTKKSHHRFESRGHLFARVEVPGWDVPLTCVCVHLGLFEKSRTAQIKQLINFLHDAAPGDSPLVVAGDFNDWRAGGSIASKLSRARGGIGGVGSKGGISRALATETGLIEVFEEINGKPARTFPAFFPMLALDRIYVRGLKIDEVFRLHGNVDGVKWRGLSDHVGLAVKLTRR